MDNGKFMNVLTLSVIRYPFSIVDVFGERNLALTFCIHQPKRLILFQFDDSKNLCRRAEKCFRPRRILDRARRIQGV